MARATQRGEFLLIATDPERGRWRLKRWFPKLYFRTLLKFAREIAAHSL